LDPEAGPLRVKSYLGVGQDYFRFALNIGRHALTTSSGATFCAAAMPIRRIPRSGTTLAYGTGRAACMC
jgi:hypothetical protein